MEPAAILPPLLLTMPPAKIEALSTKTPALECPPEIVPLLVMPPVKLDTVAGVPLVVPTTMPSPDFAMIVPTLLLLIPPAKVPTELRRIPANGLLILPLLPMPPVKLDSWTSTTLSPSVPLLVMPPAKVETLKAKIAAACAEIVPLLVIPPPNDVVFRTAMPATPVPLEVNGSAIILPLLETCMPPTMTAALLTSMPALAARIVPLSTSAP